MARQPIGWLRTQANRNTRQEILQAAAMLFSKQGYVGTSLVDIAKIVGIKAPSLYNHFKTKNEILFTYIVDGINALYDVCLQNVTEAKDTAQDKLYAYVFSHTLSLLESQETSTLSGQHHLNENFMLPEQLEQTDALQKKQVRLLKDILIRGKSDGVFQITDITVTTFFIMGAVEHSIYWFQKEARLSEKDVAHLLAENALALVKKP
ncbi:TetR/AcrR family transcriptional regulator [Paremcibacter congregatus]|uniref:TetR/AcrR family transcriptional regulator n=1 Tax=Paremcibacter congregatus TaxID=2043170 RepID=UPI003A922F7B